MKDAASITNGTLTVGPTGIFSIAGDVTLDDVGVTNQNSIEVTAGNALTLDDATTLDNSAGTVTIDGTGKLTLNDAEITGGTITDNGTIDITGSSKIDGDAVERRPFDYRGPSDPDAGWHPPELLAPRSDHRQRRENPG